MASASVVSSPNANPSVVGKDVRSVLLHVAWMSIVLGLLMQLLTLAAVALAGGKAGAFAEFMRDLTQKVTWSSGVCIGLAMGAAAAKSRAIWGGLGGLLAAPVAFVLAKSANKGVSLAANLAPTAVMDGLFWFLLIMKALQYAVLGTAVTIIAKRTWGGLRAHALAGLAVGAVFGGVIVSTAYRSAQPAMPTPKLVGQLINELVFPVGCAIVLFAANKLGQYMQSKEGAATGLDVGE